MPDLYVGEPLQLLARLPQGGAELQVDGLSPQMPWRAKLSLDPAKVSSAEGVARLWASARIAELEDQLRGGVDEASIREAVLKLALQHQLSSRYTSLVAVDRTPRRPLDADLASVQFANADPAGAIEFAATATPTELKLRLALLLAVLAGLLAVWNREGPPGRARLALEHA
jgi:Ca-activated chloride channel family protein